MNKYEFKEYFNVMESFQTGKIDASDFEGRFLDLFKREQRVFPEKVFNILNKLFSDVDCFVSDPQLRSLTDFNEAQLLASSLDAYNSLLYLLNNE